MALHLSLIYTLCLCIIYTCDILLLRVDIIAVQNIIFLCYLNTAVVLFTVCKSDDE